MNNKLTRICRVIRMTLTRELLVLSFLLQTSKSVPCNGSQVIPTLIPRLSSNTPNGYLVVWQGAVLPVEHATCFESVTLYFNGPQDMPCCYGYQNVTTYPNKMKVAKPFLAPLCGSDAVFISFKLDVTKLWKIKLENRPLCLSTWYSDQNTLFFIADVIVYSLVTVLLICLFLGLFITWKRNKTWSHSIFYSSVNIRFECIH